MKKVSHSGLCLAFLWSSSALAHLPFIESSDYSVGKPYLLEGKLEKSIAVYSSLNYQPDDSEDVYQFTLSEKDFEPGLKMWGTDLGRWNTGFLRHYPLTQQLPNGAWARRVHLGHLIPACHDYESADVEMVLIGPAQESLKDSQRIYDLPPSIQAQVKDTEGIYLVSQEQPGPIFYEAITGTQYFYPKSHDLFVTEPGVYRIFVWEREGRPVDYTFELGDIESWGPRDIRQALYWTPVLRKHDELYSVSCRAEI